jgi:hypothetical protein
VAPSFTLDRKHLDASIIAWSCGRVQAARWIGWVTRDKLKQPIQLLTALENSDANNEK